MTHTLIFCLGLPLFIGLIVLLFKYGEKDIG